MTQPANHHALDDLTERLESGDRANPKLPQYVAAAMTQWQGHQARALAILRCPLEGFPEYFRTTRSAFIAGDLAALKRATRYTYQANGLVRNISWVRLLARDLPTLVVPEQVAAAAMMGLCATGLFYLEQLDKTLSRPVRSIMDNTTYARLDGFWQDACARGALPFDLATVLTEVDYDAVCAQRQNAFPNPWA